jgi:hypothetical protein
MGDGGGGGRGGRDPVEAKLTDPNCPSTWLTGMQTRQQPRRTAFRVMVNNDVVSIVLVSHAWFSYVNTATRDPVHS